MGSVCVCACVCVLMRTLVDASLIPFEIVNNLTGFYEIEHVNRDIQADPKPKYLHF